MTTVLPAIAANADHPNQRSDDLPIYENDFAIDFLDQFISSQEFSNTIFEELDIDGPSSPEVNECKRHLHVIIATLFCSRE